MHERMQGFIDEALPARAFEQLPSHCCDHTKQNHMLKTINSIKDDRILLARALKTRKERNARGKILLEGEQILDWALEHDIQVEFILTTDPSAANVEKYTSRDIEVFSVSGGIQKKVTNTKYIIPIVGVGQISPEQVETEPNFVLVLDQVQDFGNIGTIIRTCQAFGIRDVISTTGELDVYHRKTIEASRGSVFATRVRKFETCDRTIEHLHKRGYQIIATSPRGTDLQSLVELKQQPVALVVGNESAGVSEPFEKQADFLVQIPMSEAIESLNVGVAAGISVYELRLKHILTMIEQQIKSTLGRELNVAGMLVQQALDAELRQVTDLTSQQVIFLMVLKCDREMSIDDMCKQFGVLQTQADEFLKPLLESALVAREEKLTLTSKGEHVLAKLWFTIEATEKKILSAFTPEEANALMKQLHLVQQRCVEIMAED
jgi:TrmH family RNA methyltransferase